MPINKPDARLNNCAFQPHIREDDMKTSDENDEAELTLELVGEPVSAERLQHDIVRLLEEIRQGKDLELDDSEAEELIAELRAASVPISVKVSQPEKGTGLVDLVVHIINSGPVAIIAYDVWKRILLPQLVMKYGRTPWVEKHSDASGKNKTSGSHAKAAKK